MMTRRFTFAHVAVALVLAVLAVATTRAASAQDGLLKVYFFDVGQGDAALIETPNGTQVLVDGGPDAGVLEDLGRVLPFYDRNLDVVVATHPHADHIDGLTAVLERYRVGRIVKTDYAYDTPDARAWNAAVAAEGAPVTTASVGTTLDLGTGVTLTVLSPPPHYQPKDPNDSSIVMLLAYKQAKFLLTGDAGTVDEQRELALPVDLRVDVLKVGHHGSSTASSQAFLDAVHPHAAVVSVGAHNTYRLPNQATLDRLVAEGATVYRTDEHGTVTAVTDGATVAVTADH